MLVVEIKREVPYRDIQWTTIGNIFHRHHGKAYIRWHNNGQKWSEEYWADGKLHREPLEGPADTYWFGNGQKYFDKYLVNGKRHRNPGEGPAVTYWHSNGQKRYEEHWIDGRIYTRGSFKP